MAGLRRRMESMSKYETFGAYPPRSLLSAEAALLTVWPSLSRYHDDLVLVVVGQYSDFAFRVTADEGAIGRGHVAKLQDVEISASQRLSFMNFFRDHFRAFNLLSSHLRECQLGAFCAARAHFSLSAEPCLLSLPTGSGKTALMMALAFGLRAQRVLIISPARVLRLQTAEKFARLDDLREAQAVQLPGSVNPQVTSIEKEVHTASAWKQYSNFDVVTATTRTTSPVSQQIARAPRGFFDLVFLDEAHHEPAKTWRGLIDSFDLSKTKIVLLTGTPYRRDQRPIAASLKYAYPIAQALKDGIFATVRFVNAGDLRGPERDRELARRGAEQIRRLKRSGGKTKPLLLAKSDRITHADSLVSLYRDYELKVGTVHSERSREENVNIINAARAGDIDGLVVVGMLGEGLDIPELKVAVFHRNPQSLPYTLQIIGRLARVPEGLKHGVVVGCSNDFTRETFRLYEGSEDWLKLIPELESQLVSDIGLHHKQQVDDTGAEVELADARPFFSISAEWIEGQVSLRDQTGVSIRVPRGRASIVLDTKFQDDFRIVITVTEEVPIWLRLHGRSSVSDRVCDLHVFYFGKDGLLLMQSTNEKLAKKIGARLFQSERVQPHELRRVLSANDGTYSIVGLQGSAGISGVVPAYKMLMGASAESAILNIDRVASTPGHCVMRLGEDSAAEWRGVAFASGKVWGMERNTLTSLRQWMQKIEAALLNETLGLLPRLEYLRSAVPLEAFPGTPIAAFWSTRLLRKRVTFIADTRQSRHLPELKVEPNWTNNDGKIYLVELDLVAVMKLEDNYLSIKSADLKRWKVEVDDGTRVETIGLDEFFDEYPPSLLFRDGSTVSDRIYTRPSGNPAIDFNSVKVQDWRDVTITKEIPISGTNDSVHDFVSRFVRLADEILLVYDHGTREVADYVSFDGVRKSVSFYHCKASKEAKAGARQEDMEELMAQGMASCRWIRSRDLLPRLVERIEQDASKLAAGTIEELLTLSAGFEPTFWTFEVVLVQPGLSLTKLKSPKAGAVLRPLIACAQDYVRGNGAELSIMCES